MNKPLIFVKFWISQVNFWAISFLKSPYLLNFDENWLFYNHFYVLKSGKDIRRRKKIVPLIANWRKFSFWQIKCLKHFFMFQNSNEDMTNMFDQDSMPNMTLNWWLKFSNEIPIQGLFTHGRNGALRPDLFLETHNFMGKFTERGWFQQFLLERRKPVSKDFLPLSDKILDNVKHFFITKSFNSFPNVNRH